MRSNLGPKWCERREMEREEERTMGIKRPTEPRPKEELLHYDYSRKSKNGPLSDDEVRSRLHSAEDRNNPFEVSYEGQNDSAPIQRPYTRETSSSRQTVKSKAVYVQPGRSVSAGPLRNSSRLWTPYSMIEPIFLPLSSTNNSYNDQQENRYRSASAKWEDRVGKYFWDVKEQQLNGALQRSEGNKLGHARNSGLALRKEHDRLVSAMRLKTRADFIAARERGEYYARYVTLPESNCQS